MFKLKTVSNCPHTRKSSGVVNMPPTLLAQLAAAVQDPDEWAIVLTGERSDDGYVIDVTGYFIPNQTRSSGNVVIKDIDVDHNYLLPTGERVVGVIHSHHRMGAFFSETDHTTLNTRFPMSIVIAQAKLHYLGFSYLGTGMVKLPCGTPGEIEFFIQPTEGPIIAEVKRVIHSKENLGDCTRQHLVQPDSYHIHSAAPCGLEEPVDLLANAFGREDALLAQVAKIARPPKYVAPPPPVTSWTPPKRDTAQRSILNLIFGRGKQKMESRGTLLTAIDDDYLNDEAYCEVCGQMDQFFEWQCSMCGNSEYCMTCNVGHDNTVGCPYELPVATC